jgi:SAM-dependent methyltransferase
VSPAESGDSWLRVPASEELRYPGPLLRRIGRALGSRVQRAVDGASASYFEWQADTASGAWEYYARFLTSEPRLILDLASGASGRTAIHARGSKARFVCLDRNPKLLASTRREMRERGLDALLPLTGDAYRLPFADQSFEVVLCENALEHLEQPAAALAEMTRVLRPGGRLLLLFPPWRGAYAGHLLWLTWLPWIHLLPTRTLTALIGGLLAARVDGLLAARGDGLPEGGSLGLPEAGSLGLLAARVDGLPAPRSSGLLAARVDGLLAARDGLPEAGSLGLPAAGSAHNRGAWLEALLGLLRGLSTELNGIPLDRILAAVPAGELSLLGAYVLGEGRPGRLLRYVPWVGELFASAVYLVLEKGAQGGHVPRSYNALLARTLAFTLGRGPAGPKPRSGAAGATGPSSTPSGSS